MSALGWDFGNLENTELINRTNDQLETIARTIRVAIALAANGRQLDLTGLEHQVGIICAQALDLGLEQGRGLRPKLCTLLGELDRLASLQPARTRPATQ